MAWKVGSKGKRHLLVGVRGGLHDEHAGGELAEGQAAAAGLRQLPGGRQQVIGRCELGAACTVEQAVAVRQRHQAAGALDARRQEVGQLRARRPDTVIMPPWGRPAFCLLKAHKLAVPDPYICSGQGKGQGRSAHVHAAVSTACRRLPCNRHAV